jgi:hypothetical protein
METLKDNKNSRFGRLAICRVEEVDVPKDVVAPFERWVLVDENTKAFVYIAPFSDEGFDKLIHVKKVKEEERNKQ